MWPSRDSNCDIVDSSTATLACGTLFAGTRDSPIPASGSFALRVIKHVKHCSVLLVKANSKGPYIRSDNEGMGEY